MPAGSEVVVVGGGNAGLCAALAARQSGAMVTVLERAPQEAAGGNSAFTAGLMRTVFNGTGDVLALCPDLTDGDVARSDFGAYTRANFLDDIARVTDYRCDPDLAETIVDNSYQTLEWMRQLGVRFAPSYGRQAFNVDGKFTFWGGAILEVVGGGLGLVAALTDAAHRQGIEIVYGARATALLHDDNGVHGVRAVTTTGTREFPASGVVLAAGGFQSNIEWRAKYLGAGWDLAKVRGTRYNTGDGIQMAFDASAAPAGHWSGCHAVAWDRNAPEFGDIAVGDGFQKHSYPFGIVVNADGQRFLDEGADFRNYTYAKYGRRILEQPGQFAWQVFDGQVPQLLRDEYRIRQITKVQADTIEELAAKMEDVDPDAFLKTVADFNSSVQRDTPFNPNVLDGRRTVGLAVDKTNWANPIEQPPFEAYAVTCGITFTFGGIRIDPEAHVLDAGGRRIPGLFACGEMVGGIFYFNYPGGSGLTAGSVLGRRAGTAAGATRIEAGTGNRP